MTGHILVPIGIGLSQKSLTSCRLGGRLRHPNKSALYTAGEHRLKILSLPSERNVF